MVDEDDGDDSLTYVDQAFLVNNLILVNTDDLIADVINLAINHLNIHRYSYNLTTFMSHHPCYSATLS